MKSAGGRIRIMDKNVFQYPNYKRHDAFGLNYRMSEVAGSNRISSARKDRFIC